MNILKKLFSFDPSKLVSCVDRANAVSQDTRSILFAPVLKLLTRLHVSANMLTNVRLIGIVVFVPWFFFERVSAVVFLLAILFLDTLDGALARHQNTSSDRGKFLDMIADHIVYITLLFVLLQKGDLIKDIFYNSAVIPLVYVLGAVYHKENSYSLWILSPAPKLSFLKAPVVISFFCMIFFEYDIVPQSLAVSNILSTILSIFFYIALQLRWGEVTGKQKVK